MAPCAQVRPFVAQKPLKQIAEYSINAKVRGAQEHGSYWCRGSAGGCRRGEAGVVAAG